MGVVTRRIGVLGGTFDPIHLAHLAIAEECRDQLGLAEVLFVPAGGPPHKQYRDVAPAFHRVAMVELAIASNPRFRLSRVDVDRPGLSYSVDTLRSLRDELGAEAELYFIVGSDSLVDLPSWRDPCRLIELCTIVAVNRPGYPRPDLQQLDARIPGASRRTRVVDVPDLNLTSSEIRQRVSEGRTIRYLVPDPVRAYIAEQQLYRKARGGER